MVPTMDLRLWTPLFSAVLALAIAGKVLLRPRKRRMHWLFIGFASNVAVWYLATFLDGRDQTGQGSLLARFTAFMAVLLPQTGVRFLRAFTVDTTAPPTTLDRWATYLLVPMLALVASPWFGTNLGGALIRGAISAYVVGLLIAAVSALYTRSRANPSRQERRRGTYLVGVGVLATVVTTADLVPFIVNRVGAANLPSLGSILVLAVLYMFSEVIERRRVVALYELAGRFVVLTLLALVLAGIYYRLVDWQVLARAGARDEGPYFLNAIVATMAILIVFDPLRDKVEAEIGRFFFRERIDFDRSVSALRHRLAHTLELDALGAALMQGLESSRRITTASLYLVDAERRGFERLAALDPSAGPRHVDMASLRNVLDLAQQQGVAVRDTLAREADDRRELGETREAERLSECVRQLHELHAGVALALLSDAGDLLGLLTVDDDRARDVFSQEEVQTLRGLAAQCAIVLENSRLHGRIKERDRLAALGEMAAGLAHEIRNPLGGIKGAAQYLQGTTDGDATQREFLGIIVDEVGRLDRVVRSFLDYARPYQGNPGSLDVNECIERTLQIVRADLPSGVTLALDLGDPLPPVKMDAEHLRQVILNLVRNATEAMKSHGTLTLRTTTRPYGSFSREPDGGGEVVEIHVRDTGPGIEPAVRRNLFIPFFTTKTQGTGLGLAICQRLVENVGGRIDVRASDPTGTTFAIVLPSATNAPSPSLPPPPDLSSGEHLSALSPLASR